MAYGGLNKYMDAAAELGRNPVSVSTHPEYGNEQAGAGRDCRTRLARPNYQARTGTGKFIFPVQLTTSKIGNLTRLILTLAICDGHTIVWSKGNYPKFGHGKQIGHIELLVRRRCRDFRSSFGRVSGTVDCAVSVCRRSYKAGDSRQR